MVIFYFLLLCLLTRIMQGTFVPFLLFIFLYIPILDGFSNNSKSVPI